MDKWLCFFAIVISTGFAFETVCSYTLHVTDLNSKEILSRKRRGLDEEDVINRFEMERVSPLYDIIYEHLPPFDKEWTLPGPPTNDKPPQGEFKLELTKRDEEHVISHTGKRYRENSAAINWWYSVESFTNLTSYNFTGSDEKERNFNEGSNVLNNRLEPSSRTSNSRVQEDKYVYNVTTEVYSTISPKRYDSRVDLPDSMFRTTIARADNDKNEIDPSSELLPGHFSHSSNQRNHKNASNSIQNLTEPSPKASFLQDNSSNMRTNRGSQTIPSRNFTQFGTVRKPSIRKQDEDHVVSHVASLRIGRGSPFDAAVLESPTTPRVTVTLSPKMEESESKPNYTTRYVLLQSGRIVAYNVTSVSSVFKMSSGSGGGGNKPSVPMVYFGSRLRKNSSKEGSSNKDISKPVPKPVRVSSTKAPYILHPVPTSSPVRAGVTYSPTHTSFGSLKPNAVVSDLEIMRRDKLLSTKKPIPTKPAALISIQKSTAMFVKPQMPTKSAFVQTSPRPQITTRKHSMKTEGTTVAANVVQFSVRKTTLPSFATETTKSNFGTLPTIRPIPAPTHRNNALPPRNIVETIFDVFQPDTSDLPFLIVTFDSLKKQFPTVKPMMEDKPEMSTKSYGRPRDNKIEVSRVEYEDRSRKPKLVHYNQPQRTSLPLLKSVDLRPTVPPITNSNRRSNIPSATQPPEEEVLTRVPEPFSKHEFVRKVTLPAHIISTPQEINLMRPTKRQRAPPPVATSTHRMDSPTPLPPRDIQPSTPARRSRHQQGFHLRNAVGFQTSPPGAFTDRRSVPGTTTPDRNRLVSEPPMDKMVAAMVVRFEPTRRNPRLDALQPVSATTEAHTTSRNRAPTKKPARPVYLINPPRNPEPRKQTTPPTPVRNGNSRNSRTREPKNIDVEKEVVSSTTAKPFRVYYFEPKRKRVKVETSTSTAKSLLANDLPSNIPTTQHPYHQPSRRNHSTTLRPPVNFHRQHRPTTNLPPSPPTQPVDRGRRGRARVIAITPPSPATTTSAVAPPSTKKPTRRHRHSPFIWHKPNVGLTTRGPAGTSVP